MAYTILIVARGEPLLQQVVDSALNQTIPPRTIIIFDDGNNPEIIQDPSVYIIKGNNRRHPIRGVNLIDGLKQAWFEATRHSSFDFILKLDGDSILPPTYIQNLLIIRHRAYNRGTNIGAISGVPNGQRNIRTRPRDGARLYSRMALVQAGMFKYMHAFDTYILIQMSKLGYKNLSCHNVSYLESRDSTPTTFSHWVLRGKTRHSIGLPLIHTIVASLRNMTKSPIGAFAQMFTHAMRMLAVTPELYDPYSKTYGNMELTIAVRRLVSRVSDTRR